MLKSTEWSYNSCSFEQSWKPSLPLIPPSPCPLDLGYRPGGGMAIWNIRTKAKCQGSESERKQGHLHLQKNTTALCLDHCKQVLFLCGIKCDADHKQGVSGLSPNINMCVSIYTQILWFYHTLINKIKTREEADIISKKYF